MKQILSTLSTVVSFFYISMLDVRREITFPKLTIRRMIASQSLSRKAYSVSCSLLNVTTGEAFYRKSIMEHLRFKNIDDVKVVPVETTQISCQCL